MRSQAAARALALAWCALPVVPAAAQGLFDVGDDARRVGTGSISFGVHQSRGEGTFAGSGEVFPLGDVDTRAALVGFEYRFAPRWTIEAQLPFVRRRHVGPPTHNPARLVPLRPSLPRVDDGDWHGGLQDFSATLRYDWIDDAMRVRPFLGISIPTRDYPFFGNSAIGTRLVKGRLGVEVVRPIGLSDFYWRGEYAYEVIERSYEGVSTNAHLGELELGWFANPRLRVRGFVSVRDGKGLPDDADFAGRTNLRWYFHDRNVRHNATVAGLGAEYALGERWSLSVLGQRLISGEAIHRIRFAGTVQVTRHFGGGQGD
jgi:hypothetical protein